MPKKINKNLNDQKSGINEIKDNIEIKSDSKQNKKDTVEDTNIVSVSKLNIVKSESEPVSEIKVEGKSKGKLKVEKSNDNEVVKKTDNKPKKEKNNELDITKKQVIKKKSKKNNDDENDENENEDEVLINGKHIRSFKVKLPESEKYEGRFTGLTPYQAANKALSKFFRESNKTNEEITFSICESTRKSKKSTYTYVGRRLQLEVPVKYKIQDGREIVKNFKNSLKKIKKSDQLKLDKAKLEQSNSD